MKKPLLFPGGRISHGTPFNLRKPYRKDRKRQLKPPMPISHKVTYNTCQEDSALFFQKRFAKTNSLKRRSPKSSDWFFPKFREKEKSQSHTHINQVWDPDRKQFHATEEKRKTKSRSQDKHKKTASSSLELCAETKQFMTKTERYRHQTEHP